MSSYNPLTSAQETANPAASKHSPKKKAIRANSIIVIVLAIALALGVFVLTSDTSKKNYVLVTSKPYTALTLINPDDLKVQEVPAEYVQGGVPAEKDLKADAALDTPQKTAFASRAFSATSKDKLNKLKETYLKNATLLQAVPAGVQLRGDMLTFSSFLDGDLAPTDRLVSVKASVSQAAAGTIRTGAYVDIVAVDTSDRTSSLVLTNVRVAAIASGEQQFQSAAQKQQSNDAASTDRSKYLPGDPIPGIYVLQLNADDATKAALYDETATLYLLVRPANAVDAPASSTPLNGK